MTCNRQITKYVINAVELTIGGAECYNGSPQGCFDAGKAAIELGYELSFPKCPK